MITGECHCGIIKYEVDCPLEGAKSCHCSQCRKMFGGASSAYAQISDPSKFTFVAGEEKLKRYTSKHGWAIGFCSECGSTLCGIFDGIIKGVTLGTVNGDPGIHITKHIFVGSKAAWDHIGGDAPQYSEWDE